MNKRSKVVIFSLISLLAVGLGAGSVFADWAVSDNANSFGVQIRISPLKKNITFYTEYDSGWQNSINVEVEVGESISALDIPSINVDGYVLQGWKSSAPSSDNYAIDYTSDQLADLTISEDAVFYPILKSSNKKVFVNSSYYPVNEDVVLETNLIGQTLIGYTYVGIDGIPDVSASWYDTRNLYSTSGIYKFIESDGAAIIQRKIGLKPNSNWAADWDGTGSSFGIYWWASDSDNGSMHMGVSSGDAIYAYIPANYDNFKFSRYSSTATEFAWGNQSSDFSFSGSSWSNDTHYSKDSTLLCMNSWSSWQDNWSSSLATWNPVDPLSVTEVPDNDFHNLNQYQFLQDNHLENYKTYANGSDLSSPSAMKLRFDDLASRGTYYVQVAENESALNSVEVHETTNTYYELWNAKLSTTYYYRAATSEDGLASAEIRTSTSTSLAPRVVKVPNVLNFRDIGGWDTYLVPGQKIKQGMYFRCAQLNAASGSTTSKLDNEGKGLAAIKALGIKVDIDLRDSSNVPSQSPANTTEWPVSLVKASIPSGSESYRWEGGTYQGTNIANQYVTVFNAVANCDTAPAMLHCTYGADRTGIATFFLESLLGVSIQDMTRDYVWTQFTQGRTVNLTESGAEFPQWISKTEALTGANFADKMKNHLMSFGISEHTLEHIREIFIDGYVAQA